MKTLVYHSGAVGDFIATMPALRLYRQRYPDSSLTLLGKKNISLLGQTCGIIDQWCDSDRAWCATFFSDTLSRSGRHFLQQFSSAILWTDSGAPLIEQCRLCGMEPIFQQPPFPSHRISIYEYHNSLFAWVRECDDSILNPIAVFPLHNEVTAESSLQPPKPIILHPGSGSVQKNWPSDRFLSLAQTLQNWGERVLWLQGPAEESFPYPAEAMLLSGKTLSEIARYLSDCRCFIGNDSGISHLASAVGCPTIILFGPSDPIIWAPPVPHVIVIASSNATMEAITVSDVIDTVRTVIPPKAQ
ncbi:MAG: glycosyltransferase family 9 protein [Chitinivibrionales bacterium]|nr:glycosyltransferase family 9 protein [Chitinivibrionales bacterium]